VLLLKGQLEIKALLVLQPKGQLEIKALQEHLLRVLLVIRE
jgi:hypothetical protein